MAQGYTTPKAQNGKQRNRGLTKGELYAALLAEKTHKYNDNPTAHNLAVLKSLC